MKEKLIELMKENGFYNRNEGIIELEECDVEIMAEVIIKLYNLHDVSQRSELLAFLKFYETLSLQEKSYAQKDIVDIYLKANCG